MRAHAKAMSSLVVAVLALGLAGCGPLLGEVALEEALFEEGARYEASAASRPGRPPELKRNATLPDYLAYAAVTNPGLEAAFHRWRAAVERVPQARALPDPRLSFGWFVREVETRVGAQRAKIGVSQMFPWKGKRGLRGEVALHAAEAANARYEAVKLALFHRVKRTYWRYWFLSRAVAVTEENLKLLGQLESVARAKYAVGSAPQSAVVKAQLELGRLEDRLKALRDLRRPRSARLRAALGAPSGGPLPWPKKAPGSDAVDVTFERVSAWLRENNPELRAAEAAVARAEAGVALAVRSGYPDLGIGLDYVFTGEAGMGGADSGKDPIIAMFSVSLPLARSKYRAAERQAEAERAAAVKERADRENNLAAELEEALYGFRDAERKIDLYRDTLLPMARQSIEVARQSFEAGRADFLDLIDAQRTLLEFELSHARARADRAIALAETEMLVGRKIEGEEQERRSP